MPKLNRQQLQGWLEVTWDQSKGCTRCGHTEFTIGRLLHVPWVRDAEPGLSDGEFYVVPVTCQSCSTVTFVSPVIAGALDD